MLQNRPDQVGCATKEGSKMSYWYIYTLTDPRDNRIRYVGMTHEPKRRLTEHLKEPSTLMSRKAVWIRELLSAGLKPRLDCIESGSEPKGWSEAERGWIKIYRDLGYDLTNGTDGGQGHEFTDETKARISSSQKANWQCPEVREKRITAFKKVAERPGYREKHRKIQEELLSSPEFRAKTQAARNAMCSTPEHRAMMSKATKAAWDDHGEARKQATREREHNDYGQIQNLEQNVGHQP